MARIETMKASEATNRAAVWWDSKGRHAMRQTMLRQKTQIGGGDRGNGGAFASLDPSSPDFMPSGVLHGFAWDDLDRREKLTITRVWLDQHYPGVSLEA